MSSGFKQIISSAPLILAVVFCIGSDQAAGRTLTVNRTTYNVSNNHTAAPLRGASVVRKQPNTWQGVNKSSPSAVRGFLTPYQKTNTSAGGFFPWMTQNPYGTPMRGTPAARAVCATGGCGSDIRLKTDVALLGRLENGIDLYRFRYIGNVQVFVGVMAQQVRGTFRDAVTRDPDGFFRVNYRRLGLRMQTWEEWIATTGE
jgi:hypothetical protein